jgi:hypothetical protein|mmetsp:Transcript_33947/g.55807  ORF Transcript_33947/g.55807 Transcript_33947/m.55807 type:complete len:94 (-) Transcript_33947:747-1028(-)
MIIIGNNAVIKEGGGKKGCWTWIHPTVEKALVSDQQRLSVQHRQQLCNTKKTENPIPQGHRGRLMTACDWAWAVRHLGAQEVELGTGNQDNCG